MGLASAAIAPIHVHLSMTLVQYLKGRGTISINRNEDKISDVKGTRREKKVTRVLGIWDGMCKKEGRSKDTKSSSKAHNIIIPYSVKFPWVQFFFAE